MNRIYKCTLGLLFLFLSFSMQAQEENQGRLPSSMWGYTWDLGLPVGDTNDFINDFSFRGFSIQGRKFIKSNISVGGTFGWHVFHDKLDAADSPIDFTIEFEEGSNPVTGTLTGDQFRYINSFPMMVNVHYYTGNPAITGLNIFGGIGIGTYAIKRRVEVGILAVDDTNWHFGIAPEIGFMKSISYNYRFMASIKYNQAFSAGDQKYSYLNFQIGFVSEL